LPYVTWPGTLPDRIATAALREHAIDYQIAYSSPSPALRTAAVDAGRGVYANFTRTMQPGLVVATEAFLPALPAVETGLFARQGLNLKRLQGFLDALIPALAPLGQGHPPGPPSPG